MSKRESAIEKVVLFNSDRRIEDNPRYTASGVMMKGETLYQCFGRILKKVKAYSDYKIVNISKASNGHLVDVYHVVISKTGRRDETVVRLDGNMYLKGHAKSSDRYYRQCIDWPEDD